MEHHDLYPTRQRLSGCGTVTIIASPATREHALATLSTPDAP